jgi:Meiotically Up-regulated Gene 113 (MUG113) protein
MAGFIYIMSNPSFVSGRIKIGKSDRDPEEFRKFELDGTSVPEPFKVEYYAFVDDHHTLERRLHKTFNHVRANKQREFFDVPIEEVIKEIKKTTQIILETDNYTTEETETQRVVTALDRALAVDHGIYVKHATVDGNVKVFCCGTLFSVATTSEEKEFYTRCPECLGLKYWVNKETAR